MAKKFFLLIFLIASTHIATAQEFTYPLFSTPDLVLEPGALVSDIAYSPDGRVLASASQHVITLWDTATGEILQSLSAENNVVRLKFAPDGSQLVAAVAPNQLYVWDVALENLIGSAAYRLEIIDFDIAPDGDTIALILDQDTDVQTFTRTIVTMSLSAALNGQMESREMTLDIDKLGDWSGLDFDSTGRYLAAGVWHLSMTTQADNASVYVWDTQQNAQPIHYSADFVSPIADVQFSPDDSYLLAGTYSMMAWQVGQEEVAYQAADGDLETGVSMSGDLVASAQMDFYPPAQIEYARTRVTLRNWRTGETLAIFEREIPPFEPQPYGGEGPNLVRVPVALNSAATQLAIVDPIGVISLWNLDSVAETEQEGTEVFAYCNELGLTPASVTTDQPVTIIWSWFATTIQLVRNHIVTAEYEISIDGQPITAYTLSPIRRDSINDNHWTIYYRANVGALESGTHIITYRVTWSQSISDGIAEFGPGTAQEENTGRCEFTVQ